MLTGNNDDTKYVGTKYAKTGHKTNNNEVETDYEK